MRWLDVRLSFVLLLLLLLLLPPRPQTNCRRAPRGQNAELASAVHAEVELLFRSVSHGDSDVKVGVTGDGYGIIGMQAGSRGREVAELIHRYAERPHASDRCQNVNVLFEPSSRASCVSEQMCGLFCPVLPHAAVCKGVVARSACLLCVTITI